MDSPEGSANDAITAEINRRVNKAVNTSIRPLQDQMIQLLTALNGLILTDRATLTLLASSILTLKPLPDPLKFTGKRKEYAGWSQQMWNKIRLDKRFISGDKDIWYYINTCLNHGPQQVIATFYAAGEGDIVMSGISYTKGKEKCPRLKRSYPAKAKKVKKVKKAVRPKESSSSTIEELGSSETEESLGKE
ncbi:hypothetical protein K456DRAFT_59711 [Colletotrichum gloeosporioides 23]|nr:hypothetical protein K456DRAFT_59711 [Colletotrichum gloeosporioides 23]